MLRKMAAKTWGTRAAFLGACWLLAAAPQSPAAGMPDLKITVKTTVPNPSGQTRETVTFIQNDRRRVEERRQVPQALGRGGPVVFVPAPPIVTITRCDAGQTLVLNLEDREYM